MVGKREMIKKIKFDIFYIDLLLIFYSREPTFFSGRNKVASSSSFSSFYNEIDKKERKKKIKIHTFPFHRRGCSSDGRALT